MTEPQETLLSVKAYAALFGVTERAVYMAVREERLPYPTVRPTGGAILIRVPSELVEKLGAA